MRKHVLVRLGMVAGTVTLGLAALFSLLWLASSTSPVDHAGPAKSAPEVSSHAVASDPVAPRLRPQDSRVAAAPRAPVILKPYITLLIRISGRSRRSGLFFLTADRHRVEQSSILHSGSMSLTL